MAVETLAPELVTSLQTSAREVLETMALVTPKAVTEVPEPSSMFTDEVVGLLGFTGTRSGTFVVRTTEAVARLVAARMLMREPPATGSFAETAHGFGALVSMISGNFKSDWVATGNQMDLAVPNVVTSGRVRVNSAAEGALRTCIEVVLPEGVIRVGVHFEAM